MSKKIISAILAIIMILSGFVLVEKQTVYAAEPSDNFTAPIDVPDPNATKIYTAEDLNNVRNNLSGSYVMMNDIDLSSWGNWIPIGTNSSPFMGTFDGNGHIIQNFILVNDLNSIDNDYNNYHIGLFSSTRGTIKNVGITGSKMFDFSYTAADRHNFYYNFGVIAGNNSGTISNCFNKTDTSLSININEINNIGPSGSVNVTAGGIVGGNTGTISNCYNAGNISVSVSIGNSLSGIAVVGGIVGDNSGYISSCYNIGRINTAYNTSLNPTFYGHSVYGSPYGVAISAGIVGKGSSLSARPTSYCYNNGDVKATAMGLASSMAGGIQAYSDGTSIFNCYNTGNISASAQDSTAEAGGICGHAKTITTFHPTIGQCYNIGNVNATSNDSSVYGGLLGSYYHVKIVNNYYLDNISSAIGVPTNDIFTSVDSLTSMQMKTQSSFIGFDFDNIWIINPSINNGYPYLRSVNISDNATNNTTQNTTSTPTTQNTTSTPTTNNGNVSNDQWLLTFSGDNSFLTHKITDTTYNTETCKVKVDIKQFVTPDEYSKLSDSEKDNLKLENVKLNITTPDNVSVPDSVSVSQTNRKDKSANVITLPNLSSKNNNTDLSIELGDIPYGDWRLIEITFTFKPTQDSGSYDIKFNATADNADALNTSYKITYITDNQDDLDDDLDLDIEIKCDDIIYNNGAFTSSSIPVTIKLTNLNIEQKMENLTLSISINGVSFDPIQPKNTLTFNDVELVENYTKDILIYPQVFNGSKAWSISVNVYNDEKDWSSELTKEIKYDKFLFHNFSQEIPYRYYTYLWGDSLKSIFLYNEGFVGKARLGSFGLCQGISMVNLLLKENKPDLSSFSYNSKKLINIGDINENNVNDLDNYKSNLLKNNLSDYLNLSLKEYIYIMFLTQKTKVAEQIESRSAELNDIYDAVKSYEITNTNPILLTFKGYFKGKSSQQHAVLPIRVEDLSDGLSSRIYVYDSNKENESPYFTFMRKSLNEDFSSCSYSGSDWGIIDSIYYYNHDTIDYYYNKIFGSNTSYFDLDYYILSVSNSNNYSISNEVGEVALFSNNEITNSNIDITEITNNISEENSIDIGDQNNHLFYVPKGEYTIEDNSNSDNIVSLLAQDKLVKITAPENAKIVANVSDEYKDKNYVYIDFDDNNQDTAFTVSFTNGKSIGSIYEKLDISGIGSKHIELKELNGNVILNGIKSATITVVLNDKSTSKTFTDLPDTVEINIAKLTDTIVISHDNNNSSDNGSNATNNIISPAVVVPPIYTDITPISDQYVYEETFENTPVSQETIEIEQDNTVEDAVIYGLDKTLKVGDKFVFMKGITARDDGGRGEYISNNITISGIINTYVPGDYPMIYQVTGANGNRISKRFVITVK